MTQKNQIIQAMISNGGYATFLQLNRLLDFSAWGTKTPAASVRGIVQTNEEFFKIQPGLWGLSAYKEDIFRRLNIVIGQSNSVERFRHSLIQGMITEIGNAKHFATYIPPQDKNKQFLDRTLQEVATRHELPAFTHPQLLKKAKTVDVVWLNSRNMPYAFYEIENTTDFRNSLNKFFELQDFRAKFYIVAPQDRKRQFDELISDSIYADIKDLVRFTNYDTIEKQHERLASIQSDEI